MDEDSYRSTLSNIVPQACVFERCILAQHCHCSRADRFNLAEREGVRCKAGLRNKNCVKLRDFLRNNVNFVFHLKDTNEKLPYAKQIKMQAGGLLALQNLVAKSDSTENKIIDVYQLVIDLERGFPDFQRLPMVDILKEISTFKVRRRTR